MIKITYIVIKLIEFFIFFVVGKEISKLKDDKSYWSTALPAIITFALVDGLRYMRMTDYEGNLWRYGLTDANFYQDSDILYSFAMYFCKITGIGFTGFMILQAAFLIFAIFVLLKRYKECAIYALPIVLPLICMNENFTRWFAAISFIFISYNNFIDKKYYKAGLYTICAALTHFAIILIIPLFLLHRIMDKKTIPLFISTPLLIFMTMFSNISSFGFIIIIANLILDTGIADGTSLAGHLRMMEALLAGNYLQMGFIETSMGVKIINLIKYLPIVIFGAKIATEKKYIAFYNLAIIGIIFNPLLSQVELLSRYTLILVIFMFIVASMYFKEAFKKQGLEFYCALISLFLFIYPQISLIFFRGPDNQILFIWDSL